MNSSASLLVVAAGLLILVGAVYLIVTKRRVFVLAAYFVFLPLPVLISIIATIKGLHASAAVIAASPNLTLTTAELAAAAADSLLQLLVALLISAPSYLVLAIGLFIRSLDPPTGAAVPTASRIDRQSLQLGSLGQASPA